MRTQSIRLFSRVAALRQTAPKTGTASAGTAVPNSADTTTATTTTSSSSSFQQTSGNSFKSFKEYRENAKTYGPLSASLAEQRHLTDRSEK